MGRRPRRRGRLVNGIILLDKPTGITSNAALQQVKGIYFAEKAGHTRALDPLATGMLPICLGEATKFSQFLLNSDKRYQVTAQLGQRTNTSDSDGEIISERAVDFTDTQLLTAIDQFRGDIKQIPSMFSALKYEGKPLYSYAREGIEVPREARPISIYEIKLLDYDRNVQQLKMEIHCSKGTYIRTIIDDLGELLGCGAHVIQLRRTGVSGYPADKMVTLDRLEELLLEAREQEIQPKELLDPLLLPIDTAVQEMPEVNILPSMASYILNGQALQINDAPNQGFVRITIGPEHQFVGVGEINDDGLVAPKRLIN